MVNECYLKDAIERGIQFTQFGNEIPVLVNTPKIEFKNEYEKEIIRIGKVISASDKLEKIPVIRKIYKKIKKKYFQNILEYKDIYNGYLADKLVLEVNGDVSTYRE